jgi:hypothetical protein
MPFAIEVPEMVMQPSSEKTIASEEKKNFPIKTPKSFVVIIIDSDPTILLEFNVSQIAVTIVELPSAIDYFFSS